MTRRPAHPGPLLAWMVLLVAAAQLRAAAAVAGVPGTCGRTAVSSRRVVDFICLPLGAGTCSVFIRRPPLPPTDERLPLNLREVELFGLGGSKITNVVATMSSQYNEWGASVCTDGQFTDQYCHTGDGDTNPWLRLSYPCAFGLTSLSKVSPGPLVLTHTLAFVMAESLPMLRRSRCTTGITKGRIVHTQESTSTRCSSGMLTTNQTCRPFTSLN
jgi:hypothetical protein